jgi:hypothetical protein
MTIKPAGYMLFLIFALATLCSLAMLPGIMSDPVMIVKMTEESKGSIQVPSWIILILPWILAIPTIFGYAANRIIISSDRVQFITPFKKEEVIYSQIDHVKVDSINVRNFRQITLNISLKNGQMVNVNLGAFDEKDINSMIRVIKSRSPSAKVSTPPKL